MKNIIFTLTSILLSALHLSASAPDTTDHHELMQLSVEILSLEKPVDSGGTSFVNFKINYYDSIERPLKVTLEHRVYQYDSAWQGDSVLMSTDWWTDGSELTLDSSLRVFGDTLIDSLSFEYKKDYLPFTFRTLILSVNGDSGELITRQLFMVYFTPYSTLEIWSYDDFHMLYRDWDNPDDGLLTSLRDTINKDSVPISNLTQSEFVQDSIEIQWLSFDGLGYSIPMKGLDDPDSSEVMNGLLGKADGCSGFNKQRYKGKITGSIKSSLQTDRDIAGTSDIGISGIKVKLYDKDYGWNPDDLLKVAYTDENGNFEMNVDVCQKYKGINQPENDDLELYIKVIAENEGSRVKVESSWNRTFRITVRRSNTINWAYGNGGSNDQNIGDFWPNKDACKPHLVHYADQCFRFVNSEISGLDLGGHTDDKLVIRNSPFFMRNNFMFPGAISSSVGTSTSSAGLIFAGNPVVLGIMAGSGFVYNRFFSFNDGIYRTFDDDEGENTAYHEFGHYLMWHLQNKKFNLQVPFGSHSLSFNSRTEQLAWTEGWAEGFAMIMDIETRQQDNESGFDVSRDYERRLFRGGNRPEAITFNVFTGTKNDHTSATTSTVTHGMVSEGNICALILDLYDGLSKPNLQNGINRFNDANSNWDGTDLDNVSLSFQQICQPLINNTGGGSISFPFVSGAVVQNIYDYCSELANLHSCQTTRDLKILFLNNRISNFASPSGDLVNTDDFFNVRSNIPYNTFKFRNAKFPDGSVSEVLFFHKTKSLPSFIIDRRTLLSNEQFNYIGPFDTRVMSDDMVVNGGLLTLYDETMGHGLDNTTTSTLHQSFTLDVCSDLTVQESGNLTVGSTTSGNNSELQISEGGNLLFIKPTTGNNILRINDNSRLVVLEDATLTIGENTTIILDGPNAVLEIQGNLVLQENVEFKPIGGSNGQGYVIFDMNNVQNGDDAKERIVVSNGSSMTFESTSQSNKVLEIKGQGLWIDDNGTDFEFNVNNGYVDIGEDAMLNLGCTAKFNGAMVQKTPGGGVYRGVYLWGHPNSEVKFSTFKEGATGLTYSSTKYGVRLNVLSTIFTENYTGLKTKGGGFTIKNSFVDDNTGYGMFAEGVLIPSFAYSTSFSNNSYQGLSFGSNSASKLSIIGCDIVNNPRGMVFISRNDLLIKCSNFTGISAGSSPFALDMYLGHLLMSNNFKSGYNFFGSNEENIRLSDPWGSASTLRINNGYNQFSAATGPGQGQIGIIGNTLIPANTSSTQTVFNIQADKNRWDGSSSGAPMHLGNYDVKDQFNHTMTFVDAFPMTYPNYNNATFNECLVNDMEAHRLFSSDGNTFPSEGTSISTTTFTGVPIADVTDSIMHWSGDTTNTLDQIMNYWGEVLTFKEYPLPLSSIDAYYLDFASTQMLSVAGQYLADKGVVESGDINAPIMQEAFDGLGHLIDTLAAADTSEPYSFDLKNQINLKKAHLYLTLDKLSDANNALNSMLSWADDATVEQANYWICQIGQFEYLNTHKYDYFVLDSFPTCGDTSILSPDKNGNLSSQKLNMNGDNSFVTVYPNPASNVLNISFNGLESKYQYKIYDMVGRTMIDGSHDVMRSGRLKKIDMVTLPNATYYIEVQSGDNKYLEKILIVR